MPKKPLKAVTVVAVDPLPTTTSGAVVLQVTLSCGHVRHYVGDIPESVYCYSCVLADLGIPVTLHGQPALDGLDADQTDGSWTGVRVWIT